MTIQSIEPSRLQHRPPKVPSTWATVVSVLHLTVLLWVNDLARVLGSRKRVLGLVATLASVLIAYTVATERAMSATLDPASLGDMATTYGAVLMSVPAIMTVMVFVYSPSETLVSRMLVVLPVNHRAVDVAIRAMTSLVGMALGLGMTAPLWVPAFVAGMAAPGSALIALVCVGAVVAVAALNVINSAVQRLGARPMLARGLAGLVVMGAVTASFGLAIPINGNEPRGPHQWISAPLIEGAVGTGGIANTLPILALTTVALAAFVLTPQAESSEGRDGQRTSRLLSAGSHAGLVRLELVQILRFAPNALLLLFVNILALAAGFWLMTNDRGDQLGVGVILLTVISAWGVGAYGPTRPYHWMYRTTGRPYVWIYAKLGAVLLVWMAMLVVHGAWLLLGTELAFRDLVLLVPILVVELLVGCIVGMVMPVSHNTSISGAVSEAAALALLVAVAGVMQSLLGRAQSLWQLSALSVAAVAAVLAVYTMVARHIDRSENAG